MGHYLRRNLWPIYTKLSDQKSKICDLLQSVESMSMNDPRISEAIGELNAWAKETRIVLQPLLDSQYLDHLGKQHIYEYSLSVASFRSKANPLLSLIEEIEKELGEEFLRLERSSMHRCWARLRYFGSRQIWRNVTLGSIILLLLTMGKPWWWPLISGAPETNRRSEILIFESEPLVIDISKPYDRPKLVQLPVKLEIRGLAISLSNDIHIAKLSLDRSYFANAEPRLRITRVEFEQRYFDGEKDRNGKFLIEFDTSGIVFDFAAIKNDFQRPGAHIELGLLSIQISYSVRNVQHSQILNVKIVGRGQGSGVS